MAITRRIGSAPSEDVTKRVDADVSSNATKRVSDDIAQSATSRIAGSVSGSTLSRIHNLLLLEGDQSGYILLEGDQQISGNDRLKLEGDATSIQGSVTKRVTA